MISPNTPPGTGLVVVWAEDLPYALAVFRPEYHPYLRRLARPGSTFGLRVGQRCTLVQVRKNRLMNSGFAAFIDGRHGAYPLECFEVAALPESITGLLTGAPVKEDA